MSDVHLSGVCKLAARLEVDHKVGVAVLWHGPGFAVAVAETESGRVLAWDGWYMTERAEGVKNVFDLKWDGWDDMPSKLVVEANRYWLANYLADWLMPTYSVAQEAGELVESWAEGATDANNQKALPAAELVAYMPVVDYDVFCKAAGRDPITEKPER